MWLEVCPNIQEMIVTEAKFGWVLCCTNLNQWFPYSGYNFLFGVTGQGSRHEQDLLSFRFHFGGNLTLTVPSTIKIVGHIIRGLRFRPAWRLVSILFHWTKPNIVGNWQVLYSFIIFDVFVLVFHMFFQMDDSLNWSSGYILQKCVWRVLPPSLHSVLWSQICQTTCLWIHGVSLKLNYTPRQLEHYAEYHHGSVNRMWWKSICSPFRFYHVLSAGRFLQEDFQAWNFGRESFSFWYVCSVGFRMVKVIWISTDQLFLMCFFQISKSVCHFRVPLCSKPTTIHRVTLHQTFGKPFKKWRLHQTCLCWCLESTIVWYPSWISLQLNSTRQIPRFWSILGGWGEAWEAVEAETCPGRLHIGTSHYLSVQSVLKRQLTDVDRYGKPWMLIIDQRCDQVTVLYTKHVF